MKSKLVNGDVRAVKQHSCLKTLQNKGSGVGRERLCENVNVDLLFFLNFQSTVCFLENVCCRKVLITFFLFF